jgi:FMN phosphatase YigB (HAD superfamily)
MFAPRTLKDTPKKFLDLFKVNFHFSHNKDVDGVLWKEKKIAIPTARESLHYLKNKKYPFIILTNSGSNTQK